MELSHFLTWASLIVTVMLSKISSSLAKPTYSDIDDFVEPSRYSSIDRIDSDYYHQSYAEPITDYRLSRLRRGYYYVDDGYITAVAAPSSSAIPAARRQDTVSSAASSAGTRFTPLVKYKQTRTKRKKLFVPNFFG